MTGGDAERGLCGGGRGGGSVGRESGPVPAKSAAARQISLLAGLNVHVTARCCVDGTDVIDLEDTDKHWTRLGERHDV